MEGRVATHDDVLCAVAGECEIDRAAFRRALSDGSAREALRRDEAWARKVGVGGLPSLLIHVGDNAVLTSPLVGYDQLDAAIATLASMQ